MKWASSISSDSNLDTAVLDCITVIKKKLGNKEKASLVFVFVSSQYKESIPNIPKILNDAFPESVFFGCSAAGILGDGQEVQNSPSITLMAAVLPSTTIVPFYAPKERLPSEDDPPDAWTEILGIAHLKSPDFLLLAEPFAPHINQFLAGMDYAFPKSTKIGGLVSGGTQPGTNHLYLGNSVYTEGIIGLAFDGDLAMEPIVAQGCRPIGEPKQITKCQANVLIELDNESPLNYLSRIYQVLPDRDQELFRSQLLVGIGVNSVLYQDDNEFLIRNIMGTDPEKGVLGISELVREGQIVQFHLRDAVSSAEDLKSQLHRYLEASAHPTQSRAAIMFECTGRGSYLYGEEGHDSNIFAETIGSIPLTGFFCNGEIGPVGDTTYLHGYTASIAIFHSKTA